MNERIKRLALDAGIGFTLWDDSGREMIDNYTPEEYLEKFAELIVQECLEDCSRTNDIRHFVPPGQQQVVLDCMREIEETFRS